MKLIDLYNKHGYTPPMGGIEIASNIEIIFGFLMRTNYTGEIILTKIEFLSIFRALKDEILVSMILSGNKKMNEYFKDGIELRGFNLKIEATE